MTLYHLAGDDHGQESAVELVVVVAAAAEVVVGDPGVKFQLPQLWNM